MEQKSEEISPERKQPEELSSEEKLWNSKSPQEKVDILAKIIGREKLEQLFTMVEILQGGVKTQKILTLKPRILEKAISIDKGLQELRLRKIESIEIIVILLDLLAFNYAYDIENKSENAQYFACSRFSWQKDGIDNSTFETVKWVYDSITALDKMHPEFIQKNPKWKPLDYFYTPTEEDKKVIAKFFPNLENKKLQIPFSVKYWLDVEGATLRHQKSFKYGSKVVSSSQISKESDITISFRQLVKKDDQELRGTLINETWHYLYALSIPKNLNLADALRGQLLAVGPNRIPLWMDKNGENEFLSDAMSLQIDPLREIERIYKWSLQTECDKYMLLEPRASTGYQFCVKVFSAILVDLFWPDYQILRDQEKLSKDMIGAPDLLSPKKLQNILNDPEKIHRIQKKYMEIGYDLATRLWKLKNSPTYTESIEPKNAIEVLMRDVNVHPTGNYYVPPKLPPASSKLGQK